MKPKLAVRPRPPLDPLAVEKFVSGAPERPEVRAPGRSDPQTLEKSLTAKGLVERKDGKVRRRMTVYLPPDLARSLMLRSLETGEEASELVSRAVSRFLASAQVESKPINQ
jgi:hypothetical protein